MVQSIPMQRFLQALLGDRKMAAPAAEVGRAVRAACSLRQTEVAAKMRGRSEAAYKRIGWTPGRSEGGCFGRRPSLSCSTPLRWNAPRPGRPNPWGRHGALGDPHRGRAIPWGWVCYSSRTIANRGDSRNQNPMRAIETRKDIGGDRPVGSYLGFWQDLEAAQVSFVLRLHPGTHPKFQDSRRGPKAVYWDAGSKGERGPAEPLWVMSNLEPEEALRMDLQRMEVDATFRDRKDLLGLERRMNRSQEYMEKMVALPYRAPRGGESGRRLRSRGNPASLPTRRSRPARLPRPSLPPSPGILRPRPGQAGRDGNGNATPVCSYSSCRSGS